MALNPSNSSNLEQLALKGLSTVYLQCSALIREWRTKERYQNVHHSCCYVILQNFVGVVSIMRCDTHLQTKNVKLLTHFATHLMRFYFTVQYMFMTR